MKILVFEQKGSGFHKVSGIKRFGNPDELIDIVAIDGQLPEFLDEPEEYIDETKLDADLVLNYLTHPDLSHYLIELCSRKDIPIVSSGKHSDKGYTPFTCCGLGRHAKLGSYGEYFGFPEYRVKLEGEKIKEIQVLRGAPCGATWDAVSKVIGVSVHEALSLLPRLVQYHCTANPGRFDPITGKSPVHHAGYAHRAALKKAIEQACKKVM